jgi:hypothetical protein
MTTRSLKYSLPAIACVAALACSGGSPTDPGGVDTPAVANPAGSNVGTAAQHAPNNRPTLRLKTTPTLQEENGRRFVSGVVSELVEDVDGVMRLALPVNFNLCASSDPDENVADDLPTAGEGDTLNYQFHWGDGPPEYELPPVVNPDGTFRSDFAGECSASHNYYQGNYVATLSVTDRHQEDNQVTSLAREVVEVDIIAMGVPSGNMTTRISPVLSPEASWFETLWA